MIEDMTDFYNENFNPEDVRGFARFVNIPAREKGSELEFLYCPLCRGGRNRDRHTFSMSLNNGKFECKRSSCGYHGNLVTLSKDFNYQLSEPMQRYYDLQNRNKRLKQYPEPKKHIESTDKAVEFMKSRGISEKVCRDYEITTENDNIVKFPFKNEFGELKFVKYRDTSATKENKKRKEWCDKDAMQILFGMNHADPNDGPLIITEGQIDALSVAESGLLNAVSVPMGCKGFVWLPHCWDWFQSFKELIIFGDFENGHMTLTELAQKFNGVVRLVREEDYQGCKDANEILQRYGKEAVVSAVTNAKMMESAGIVRISNVKRINLDELECISTGIKEIDDVISGGFHTGELILLTGKRGDGKSTFMSQLMVNAMRQGYKSFAYSGELSNSFFKAWIDKQICGKWKILPSEYDRLDEFYDDLIFLYDSTALHDDNEMEVLLKLTEQAIKLYGCRLICIDNLMTAVETNTNEKLYRMQSQFVGKLKDIAKKYDVVIVLVAHPRKSNGYEFSNDDVSGSADITNKVDVVLSYNRPKPEDNESEDARQLLITKNRLTGQLTNDRRKIFLYYCADNKRIAGADKDFYYDTGWRGAEPIESIGEEVCPF